MKRVEAAAVAADAGKVLAAAERVPPGGQPGSNNINRHLLDVAWAHTQGREYGDARAILLRIKQSSPAWLRQQRYARDIVELIASARRRASAAAACDRAGGGLWMRYSRDPLHSDNSAICGTSVTPPHAPVTCPPYFPHDEHGKHQHVAGPLTDQGSTVGDQCVDTAQAAMETGPLGSDDRTWAVVSVEVPWLFAGRDRTPLLQVGGQVPDVSAAPIGGSIASPSAGAPALPVLRVGARRHRRAPVQDRHRYICVR
jgi:hypothetical protein